MAQELTKKQEFFIAEYLVDLNATRAAVAAGYAKRGAAVTGSRLLRNAKVAQRIAPKHGQRLEKLEISADRVVAEIGRIAFFDPRKLFNEDGSPRDIKDLDDDTASAVAGLEVVELFDGSEGDQKHVTGLMKKIKLADKLKALELAGRYLKLFTDKVEHSGTVSLEQLVCGGDEDRSAAKTKGVAYVRSSVCQ
jgi:phage terminase small subunit